MPQLLTAKNRKISALIVIFIVAGIGAFLLIKSFAASPLASFEAENANLSGNVSIGNDAAASGGKYIQFGSNSTPNPPPPPPPPNGDATITAAGDIACDPTDASFNGLNGTPTACQMKATSDLVLSIKPTAALTLGDNQYESGTLANYQASYGKTWGRFDNIIHPAIGNHEGGEGQTHSSAGYFDYFNGKGVQT